MFWSSILHSGYAEKWAKARLEQQELKLHLQRRHILNKLSEYSKGYNAEQIVSAEMSNYLEADIKEKEEQIDMWTKKYKEEIVERQQEIDELKVYSKIDTIESSGINKKERENKYNLYNILYKHIHMCLIEDKLTNRRWQI